VASPVRTDTIDSGASAEARSAPSAALPQSKNPDTPVVLVLGSAGLVGRYLGWQLERDGYEVLHVYNRTHVDLRVPGALEAYVGDRRVDFCFFLACEVGGSKFLENKDTNIQLDIVEHNVAIYQQVLPFLRNRRIPFLFSSSYLQAQPSPYGTIKRLGEAWIRAQRWGKIVRFWNIYGEERIGLKSHVIQDWTSSCVAKGKIQAATDGYEQRQFLHARDLAQALVLLMRAYDQIPDPAVSSIDAIDVSGGEWTPLRRVADIIQSEARKLGVVEKGATGDLTDSTLPDNATSRDTCDVVFSDRRAMFRTKINPNMKTLLYNDLNWTPVVTMEEGIRELLLHAKAIADADATVASPHP